MAVVLVTARTAVAAPDPLLGHWTAPDTYDNDGSTTHMIIFPGPNGTYRIHAWDNPSTSGCPVTHGLAMLNGTATFDSSTNTITKTVVASCPSEGTSYPPATLVMYYDPNTNTIYDPTFTLAYSK